MNLGFGKRCRTNKVHVHEVTPAVKCDAGWAEGWVYAAAVLGPGTSPFSALFVSEPLARSLLGLDRPFARSLALTG